MINHLSFYILAFLGVFIETVPFLLLGALVSGLAAAFLTPADLKGLLLRRRLLSVPAAALLGLFFPVGAAGAAPLARRFYRSGFPLPAVIAFWLAAPALNPISLAVMLVLLGPGPLLWGRVAVGYGAAVLVGAAVWIILEGRQSESASGPHSQPSLEGRGRIRITRFAPRERVGSEGLTASFQQAFLLAVDDLFDFAPYLLVGALLAALPRAFLPQQASYAQLVTAALAGNSLTQIFLAHDAAGRLSALVLTGVLALGPLLGLQNLSLLLGVFRQPEQLPPRPLEEGWGEASRYRSSQEGVKAPIRAYRAFQTLILIALGLFILWQAWGGEMRAYVDERQAPLVILAGLGCLVLAEAARSSRKPVEETAQDDAGAEPLGRGRRWKLLALALPLVAGLILTAYGGQERLRAPMLASEEIGGKGPVILTFAQPMNPASVEQRFEMQPSMRGRFTWDGDQLKFWPQEPLVPGQTYTVRLDGGASSVEGRAIFNTSQWKVTVRRPWVLYMAPMNEGPELWRSRTDGSGQQQLTDTGGRVQDFGVSPDGEWIAYSVKNDQGGSDLRQVNLEGQTSLLLDCGADICEQPAVALDGSRVAYVFTSRDPDYRPPPGPYVQVFDRTTGERLPLPLDRAASGDTPSWSPDGQRLAFYDTERQRNSCSQFPGPVEYLFTLDV